jgi:hypothetical protein
MSEIVNAFNTQSTRSKLFDRFYIKFPGLPENFSNVLGRQVRTFNRPNITFEETEIKKRGYQYKEKGYVRFNPITVVFWDDEGSMVSSILYAQVMRQLNKHVDIFGREPDSDPDNRDYRFDIQYDILTADDKVIESFVLRNCFLTEINHDPLTIDDDGEVTITAIFAYDNISCKIFDEYVDFLDGRNPI